jgi:hypothetical protein
VLLRKMRHQRPLVIDPVAMLEISKRIYGKESQQKSVQAGASDIDENRAGKEEVTEASV